MRLAGLLALTLLFAGTAPAQQSAPPPGSILHDTQDSTLTDVERQVRDRIAGDGLHVVHFWAPWCHNSIAELRSGWYEAIEQEPDVSFTFVAIWNDGQDGAATLRRFAVPERVLVLAQPDHGPSAIHAERRRTFLGLPLYWTPSTWIFHQNGRLAYAVNYGEMDAEMLRRLLDLLRRDWSHD